MARRKTEKVIPAVCPDLDVCMIFRKYAFEKWFTFNTFKYATDVKRIGDESANGVVRLVTYTRFNLNGAPTTAYAVIKSMQRRKSADNLWYEYLVGQFINKQKLPTFIATYGVFHVINDKWGEDVYSLKSRLRETTFKPYRLTSTDLLPALMLQYAPGEDSFGDFLDHLHERRVDIREFWCLMYHLYYSLASLADVFTHYDLHLYNLRVVEISKGKTFQFVYPHVTFTSRYMIKIIDYGKSYFYDTPENNSEVWRSKMPYVPPSKTFIENAIDLSRRNVSCDLRPLLLASELLDHPEVNDFLKRVVFTGDRFTPELVGVKPRGRIRNVLEAELALRDTNFPQNEFDETIRVS
jgi:hypothetical protein